MGISFKYFRRGRLKAQWATFLLAEKTHPYVSVKSLNINNLFLFANKKHLKLQKDLQKVSTVAQNVDPLGGFS